jgi:hypothetical protein
VVWEDLKTVKLYEDHPRNYYIKLYTYHEQVHGWPEPIVLDKKFEKSLEHRAVWFIVIDSHSSNRYFLNDYKNTGISETIYLKNFKETLHGGSHWGEEKDRGWFEYSASKGLELKMNLSEMSIINDILHENAPHAQLSLF